MSLQVPFGQVNLHNSSPPVHFPVTALPMHLNLATQIICYLLGLALLATGCRKDDVEPACQGNCTIISGRLTTGQPQRGLANAIVTAKWTNFIGLKGIVRTKARTVTDADGRYNIQFYIADDELIDGYFSVFFTVDENRYYTIGEPRCSFFDLKRDTTVLATTFHIPRKAYVRVAISNLSQLQSSGNARQCFSDFNSCYGGNRTFSWSIQGGGPVFSWDSFPMQDPVPVPGDQAVIHRIMKSKDGVATTTRDSMLIPAGATRSITVTY